MIKRLLLLFFMLPLPALAWEQKPLLPPSFCSAQIPYGMPQLAKPNTTIECHTAYILQHDNDAKLPSWVAYTLTPQHAIGCVRRSNAFEADNALPKGQRSEPSDYVGSGYDKGHLANNEDMSWDQQVEFESFLMSNMSAQTPATNRGIWKILETDVRAWVFDNNTPFTIYAGNIYSADGKTIGNNKVVVPDFLYKIIINNKTNEVQAYIFPNIATNQGTDITPFLTNVDIIEQKTGIHFPLPQGIDKTVKASSSWPVDLKTESGAKKSACGISK